MKNLTTRMIKVKFKYCIWFSIPNMDKKKFYTTQPSFDQKLSLYQKYKNDHAFKNWLVKLMYFMNDFNNDILPYWTVQIEHQLQWIYHLQVFVRYKSWYIDERWTATMYVPYCMLFTDRTSQFSSKFSYYRAVKLTVSTIAMLWIISIFTDINYTYII